ncbi:MAG: hypothetical protein RBT11_06785 [Desulfobacterales bacterium]|jgi:hypothetical protein|nr:hypothetical protein [Desulfobacterales bacterium]
MNRLPKEEDEKRKPFAFKAGKLYFTRSVERLFFLVLTVGMAVLALIREIALP